MLPKKDLKFIRSLHQKKFRDENKMYIAEGLKIVNEAILNQSQSIDQVIVSSSLSVEFKEKIAMSQVKVVEVSSAEFERLSTLRSPQGILAVLKQIEKKLPSPEEINDIVIILDQVSDPGNLGTLIRLADWFGIRHIICSADTVECYNPKVVQASMGALFRMNIVYTELSDFLTSCRKTARIKTYGTSLEGQNIYSTKLLTPALILFGNETNGISKELADTTDTNLLIPTYSQTAEKTESLNVSIAAAIVCSEFRRQAG
jgi:RNA methyltransferase, TrmH family